MKRITLVLILLVAQSVVAQVRPQWWEVVIPTCSGTDKLAYNGSAFVCGTDLLSVGGAPTDATYVVTSANTTLTAEAVLPTCSGNDKLTFNGTTISCAADQNSGSGITTARVTGSNATTTGQALTNVTGLSIALLANTTYEFEAIISVQSSSTAGNQYGVQFSAAGASVESQIGGTLTATTARFDRISALNTATPAYVTSGATGGIRIQGVIAVGANAGNLTVQHLKVTSGTSTVFINSFLKARPI